jgi:hypothetical protein
VRGRYTTSQASARKSNFPAQSSPITKTSAQYFLMSSTFCSQLSYGNTWSTYRIACRTAFLFS